jgi:hypothetical protein
MLRCFLSKSRGVRSIKHLYELLSETQSSESALRKPNRSRIPRISQESPKVALNGEFTGTVYPTITFQRLIEKHPSDIVATVLFHFKEISSCDDKFEKVDRLKRLQSTIYMLFQDERENPRVYRILSVLDSGFVSLVSPSLRAKEKTFVRDAVLQVAIRLSLNGYIFQGDLLLKAIGPHSVSRYRHVINCKFSSSCVEKTFQALRSDKGICFESVRFAFELLPPNQTTKVTLETPLGDAKNLTFGWLLNEIEHRRAPEMLKLFVFLSPPTLKLQLIDKLQERHPITGFLLHPWSHSMISSGLDITEFNDVDFPLLFQNAQSPPALLSSNETLLPSESAKRKSLSDENTFFIDSVEGIVSLYRSYFSTGDARVKQVVLNPYGVDPITGNPEVLAVLCEDQCHIIDLYLLRNEDENIGFAQTLKFFLFEILACSEIQKVVYAAESFFDRAGALNGSMESIFEVKNLTDLRRPWIKRKFKDSSHPVDPLMDLGQKERNLRETLEKGKIAITREEGTERQTTEESIEMFESSRMSFSELCEFTIKKKIPGKIRFEYDFSLRPISYGCLREIARETQCMKQVSDELKRSGFVPQEILQVG